MFHPVFGRCVPRGARFLQPEVVRGAREEMGQLFDEFFGPKTAAPTPPRFAAPLDAWEHEGKLYVEVELPGVAREDVEVVVHEGQLRLAAEKKAPADRPEGHAERRYGRCERVVTLPDAVDPDSVTAEFRDGVLRVTLAKRPEVLPKKIQVQAG